MMDKRGLVAIADSVITLIILIVASGYMYYMSMAISEDSASHIHNRLMDEKVSAALKTVLSMTYIINNTSMSGMDVVIKIYDMERSGEDISIYLESLESGCNNAVQDRNWALRIHSRELGEDVLIKSEELSEEIYGCTIDIPRRGDVIEVTMYIW